MIQVTDLQKIGIGLAAFGMSFLFLGILFLFDKGLLAIGNILFLSGLGCVIGLERTFRFFFQRHKIKGTAAFFGGIFVVLIGFPIIGMIIESYGFFALFSGFFPVAVNFLGRIPILGSVLNFPFIQKTTEDTKGQNLSRTPENGIRINIQIYGSPFSLVNVFTTFVYNFSVRFIRKRNS